ncbi:MAG: hypothetical protein QOK29_544 [Rhodospirillaceae bacterium]|jgi:hypothetical protein|nr:hypothetical protein [Rhodospirillaceae bacterium]
MPFMDRQGFISLLERLGDPDDAAVVKSAREIHRVMQAEGISWDELLRASAEDEDSPISSAVPVDPALLDEPANAAVEDLALIDALLARDALSETTRQEIEDMRADIQRGDFTARDRKYLQDLAARLRRQA